MLLLTFGAGLTYAAALLEWGLEKQPEKLEGIVERESTVAGEQIAYQAKGPDADEIRT